MKVGRKVGQLSKSTCVKQTIVQQCLYFLRRQNMESVVVGENPSSRDAPAAQEPPVQQPLGRCTKPTRVNFYTAETRPMRVTNLLLPASTQS